MRELTNDGFENSQVTAGAISAGDIWTFNDAQTKNNTYKSDSLVPDELVFFSLPGFEPPQTRGSTGSQEGSSARSSDKGSPNEVPDVINQSDSNCENKEEAELTAFGLALKKFYPAKEINDALSIEPRGQALAEALNKLGYKPDQLRDKFANGKLSWDNAPIEGDGNVLRIYDAYQNRQYNFSYDSGVYKFEGMNTSNEEGYIKPERIKVREDASLFDVIKVLPLVKEMNQKIETIEKAEDRKNKVRQIEQHLQRAVDSGLSLDELAKSLNYLFPSVEQQENAYLIGKPPSGLFLHYPDGVGGLLFDVEKDATGKAKIKYFAHR